MGIFVCVVVSIFLWIISQIYYRYEERIFGQESLNTLHTLDTSIQSFFESADNYSKMLVSDSIVQEEMEHGDLINNVAGQRRILQKVYSMLQFSKAVSEIWFIDSEGNTLKIGAYSSFADDKNLEDYAELRTAYGRARVMLVTNDEDGSISLVRSYNSTSDFTSLGIIGVVISDDNFRNMILQTIDVTKEKLLIVDEKQDIVFWSDDGSSTDDYLELATLGEAGDTDFYRVEKLGRQKMLMSSILCTDRNWRIIRYTPLPINMSEDGLLRLNMAIFVLVGIIMIAGASVMAVILARPVKVMLEAMATARDGVPERISESSTLREFSSLYDGYNSMVERIRELIDETIERQKRIRQVELNEIQEQMKPHFLYNTLESVEALAMMGDTERVCQLIEALGDFYRKSVSGGKEFLTIGEEIRIAKDYIQIMEIRFGDSFNTDIRCDSKCLEYMIPKLTIQPLVENAFQHGVRARNNHGDVFVNVELEGDHIHISIADSGDGVPEEIVNEILYTKQPVKGKSLGLRGTIERLRLMYGESFKYEIARKPSKIDLFINVGGLSMNGEE